jgi:EPS-associated MarR family transcriptional regulator
MNEHSVREDIFNILRILSSNNACTQRQLSSHLGISLGKTNYLLRSSMQKGLIKIMNFSQSNNKLKKVRYILTKKGLEEKLRLTHYFFKKKEKEYIELKGEFDSANHTYNLEYQESIV